MDEHKKIDKKFNKYLFVGTAFFAIFLIGFWWNTKRGNTDYYIPADFEGWITIIYSVPGAPALEKKDGAYQVHITDSLGFFRTSSYLEQGWARNNFFRESDTGSVAVPKYIEKDGEYGIFVHRNEYYHYSHGNILDDLAVGTDTMLWDGTRIKKYAENDFDFSQGVKVVEFFYISKGPKPLTFNPPVNQNDVSDKPERKAFRDSK